jgi:thiamine pyrophosphokinase
VKIVVVLAGDPPGSILLEWRMKWAEFSIATDAGMKAFVEAGLEPDLLVGDFDSFDPEEARLACEVNRIESQNQTDFQKALARPEVQRAQEIVILGGTGGRSDHFLTNLMIAAGMSANMAVLFDAKGEIIYRVTPERPLALQGLAGQTISLIPMGSCNGVTATGLRWPLSEVDMGPGEALSQSNLAEADEIEVRLQIGTLYVIVLKH